MRAKAAKAKLTQIRELDDRETVFVSEYLATLDAYASGIKAGYSESMAKSKCYQWVSDGKLKPHVYAAVQAGQAKLQRKTGITQERVLEEVWNIATADPRELVEYRVGCCRHCWGKGHRYQSTKGELEAARQHHAALVAAGGKLAPKGPFDVRGGDGYRRDREPNPECPDCVGEGIGRTVFHDTRKISTGAASLFAGVKESDKGLEIKVHSKDAALDKVMRHLGMYKDKLEMPGMSDFVKAMLHARERAKSR